LLAVSGFLANEKFGKLGKTSRAIFDEAFRFGNNRLVAKYPDAEPFFAEMVVSYFLYKFMLQGHVHFFGLDTQEENTIQRIEYLIIGRGSTNGKSDDRLWNKTDTRQREIHHGHSQRKPTRRCSRILISKLGGELPSSSKATNSQASLTCFCGE
jgi:hypothetical protein